MTSEDGQTYSFLEGGRSNPLLLLSLHGVIKQDSGLENVKFALREEAHVGEECASGFLERVRQEEAENEAAQNGKSSHNGEQPKPTRLTTDTSHVQDTIGKEFGGSLSKLVTKVEEHDSLGSLAPCVPGRKSPETTWDETRLRHSQEETSSDEGGVVGLEGLECADGAEEEELESEPLAGANSVEDHVGRNLEQDNTQGEHLLANVELILCDTDIVHKLVCEGVRNVSSIEFCIEL